MPPAPLRDLYVGWKRLEFIGIPLGRHRPVNNKGFECRPRHCKAFMEGGNPCNSLEIVSTPTDQAAIRDSKAHTAARLLWRVEIF